MGKVIENTGKRVLIYSDNGLFRFIASRRAITENYNGTTYYNGSKWFIETSKKVENRYLPFRFSGLHYIISKKCELIDLLSRSVQFKQAYEELKRK